MNNCLMHSKVPRVVPISILLHIVALFSSHRLKNNIFQAIEGLKLSLFPLHENEGQRSSVEKKSKSSNDFVINFEHAPLHDLVFIGGIF